MKENNPIIFRLSTFQTTLIQVYNVSENCMLVVNIINITIILQKIHQALFLVYRIMLTVILWTTWSYHIKKSLPPCHSFTWAVKVHKYHCIKRRCFSLSNSAVNMTNAVNMTKSMGIADLVSITEEIVNGKFCV